MTTLTFDTLDAARSLRNAGVDEKTAEAIVAVVRRTTELPDVGHLATKDQIELLSVSTREQFRAVSTQIDGLEKRFGMLQAFIITGIGFNFAGVLGVAAFIYNVVRH